MPTVKFAGGKRTFPYNAVGKAQAHAFAQLMKGEVRIIQATAWRKKCGRGTNG